jgi:hypothetical protein
LGGLFDVGGTIFILHDDQRARKVELNRTLYWFVIFPGGAGAAAALIWALYS